MKDSTRRSRSRRGTRWLGSLCMIGALLFSWDARATSDADRLIGEVASDDVREALGASDVPMAIAQARADAEKKGGRDRWELVLLLAGWGSDQTSALVSLRKLVALAPDDAVFRFRVAQILLWEEKTSEALPHARWLEEHRPDDPAATEVVVWILLAEGDKDGALGAAKRWAKLDPENSSPLWIVADLTHWSAKWRVAKEQYKVLVRREADRAKALERMEMLRNDHPTQVREQVRYWTDNQGVEFLEASAQSTHQLHAPIRLDTNIAIARWSELVHKMSWPRPPLPPVFVNRAEVTARYEWLDEYWPEISGGVEADSEGNVSPVGSLGMRVSIAGWIFGRAWFQYDRFRVSRNAAAMDVRWWGPQFEIYTEPASWIFVSAVGDVSWISDGNIRNHELGVVGFHNTGKFQVEPRGYVERMKYAEARVGALPYYTPTDEWVFGTDLTLRYKPFVGHVYETSFGVVEQNNSAVYVGGFRAKARLWRHLQLELAYTRIGSPEYNQDSWTGALGWVY